MVSWLKFNIIEKIPFMVYLEIQCITFKTEKSFIAHPWIQLSVVGLEEYSAHDWRAATSVQRAPVTWREWGLCGRPWTNPASHQITRHKSCHYNDVIMSAMSAEITSLTIVYSSVYSGADQIKHQSSYHTISYHTHGEHIESCSGCNLLLFSHNIKYIPVSNRAKQRIYAFDPDDEKHELSYTCFGFG